MSSCSFIHWRATKTRFVFVSHPESCCSCSQSVSDLLTQLNTYAHSTVKTISVMIPPLKYVLPEVFGLEMCFQRHRCYWMILEILQEHYRQQSVSEIFLLSCDHILVLVALIMTVKLLCRVYRLWFNKEYSIYSVKFSEYYYYWSGEKRQLKICFRIKVGAIDIDCNVHTHLSDRGSVSQTKHCS